MEETLKNQIANLYEDIFFKDKFANKETGEVVGTNKKIATYPYIGDKYGKSTKILVIGLDIGQDETPNSIQSFEERNQSLKCVHDKMNFHMGGTYFTALYLLMEELGYTEFYEKVKNETIFNTIIKRHLHELPIENPLDYIALTNFYKYVTIGRINRKGSFDRIHIDKNKRELDLFFSEIRILNPDVLFFQSSDFQYVLSSQIIDNLKKEGRKIFIASHPSKALPKLKYPEYYFRDYCKRIN